MPTAKPMAGPAVRIALIVLLFTGAALNYVDRQVVALLKPTLEAHFHWSDRDFAHLGSAFQVSAAAALLFVGWLVDRMGVRIAYAGAVLVWSVAGMGHAFAHTVGQFVLARAILAAGESVSTPAGLKAATLYLPPEQRNRAIGLANAAPNLGAILTPLLLPPFAVAFGWRAAFLVTGGLGLVWLVAWLMGTRRLQVIGEVPERSPVDWSALFNDRASWAIIGAKVLTDAVWWFVLLWMPDFFHRQFGMSQAALGGPVALIFVLAAAGALTAGGLNPYLRRHGLTPAQARRRAMLGYALIVLVMPLALACANPWLAALFIGFGIFAHQGFSTNIFAMTTEVVPAGRVASVIALAAVAGNLAGMGIIEFAGWSLASGWGYGPLFGYAACAYLAAFGWIVAVIGDRIS